MRAAQRKLTHSLHLVLCLSSAMEFVVELVVLDALREDLYNNAQHRSFQTAHNNIHNEHNIDLKQ